MGASSCSPFGAMGLRVLSKVGREPVSQAMERRAATPGCSLLQPM